MVTTLHPTAYVFTLVKAKLALPVTVEPTMFKERSWLDKVLPFTLAVTLAEKAASGIEPGLFALHVQVTVCSVFINGVQETLAVFGAAYTVTEAVAETSGSAYSV